MNHQFILQQRNISTIFNGLSCANHGKGATHSTDTGIYRDHLHRCLWYFQQHPSLLEAFKQVVESYFIYLHSRYLHSRENKA
ncbi:MULTISPECIES: AAA-like domain-containing protein [Spirulina sp. CCY15215]|uniref:AAA-like domain-containing protein n=1 Tax=Spirulina sp. CCY15215 TaxID=2767591 RepID=UPI00195039C7